MHRRRLLWRLFMTYLLVIVVALAAVAWFTFRSLRHFLYNETSRELLVRTHLLEHQFDQLLAGNEYARIDSLCKDLEHGSDMRLTVVLPDGRVVGDSEADPAQMENHAQREEIALALTGKIGVDERLSHTTQRNFLYLARPLYNKGGIIGVIRAAYPLYFIDRELTAAWERIALGSLVIAVAIALASLLISRHISKPLEELRRTAQRLAAGDLGTRLAANDSKELADLAEALNQLAHQLNERMQAAEEQRNRLEAMLAGMVEGVLAVDNSQHLITVNQSAAEFLGIQRDGAVGRTLPEVVRNVDLQTFVGEIMTVDTSLEDLIISHGAEERYFQAHGTPLYDSQGLRLGALVVLNDVTRLRRLESIRRDFVANVSHELRTPVTSIKGFVETLLEGASKNPQDTQRFLKIISQQAERLEAIIEDLLSLSRIEQESESSRVELEATFLRPILESAAEACRERAREKNLSLEINCDPNLQAQVNRALLEQALINLLDNAIKYSDTPQPVRLSAERTKHEVQLSVSDRGRGIPAEHLPRIFERFYRVDKARSRKLGGTGLGLAIVKHIAQAQGGTVAVVSEVGQGSTFTIKIPQ